MVRTGTHRWRRASQSLRAKVRAKLRDANRFQVPQELPLHWQLKARKAMHGFRFAPAIACRGGRILRPIPTQAAQSKSPETRSDRKAQPKITGSRRVRAVRPRSCWPLRQPEERAGAFLRVR